MRRLRVLGGLVGLSLLVACSEPASKPDEGEKIGGTPARAIAPPAPGQTPELPETGERDGDGNKLDDAFDEQLARAGNDARSSQAVTKVQVILSTPVEQAELDDFVADGGKLRYVFRELSYGWTGAIALEKLPGLAARLGDKLHLLAAPRATQLFMDEATRTGRIRGIWAASFAGSTSGYSGNSNITVAVLDTGVDSSHTDLSGRMQGWQDYTSDAAASARDVAGHGTHVASIAVGTGAAFGAATAALKFTQSGSLSGVPSGSFLASTVHTPTYLGSGVALSASASASFLGGVATTLHTLRAPDGSNTFTSFANTTGTSPLTLSNQNGGTGGMIYQGALLQANPVGVSNFAIANTIADYPGVGDGFNALRGVAPTCKWFGGKVFSDTGVGNSFDIEEGLDDVVARKAADNIKIVNLSLGVLASGTDSVARAKVNTAVDAGVVVVVAAGNDGPSNTIGDPGRASKVITVGAANDVNELTTYTSIGALSPGADEDSKPDLVAPGGSAFRSGILAADSNTADGNVSGFGDVVANDYSSLQGTSMATPFVSGSVALMIDALQQSGTSWSFGSSTQPLFLKMLLLASATELNVAREQAAANSPTLGRASTPKDRFEGYGIINPDAAIEAMLQTFVSPLSGSVSNTAPARLEWERRAWGRKLSLVNGATVILNLAVPSTADYDLYLYAGTGDAKGNPLIRASSVNAGNDSDETISFTSSATETAYMFVKRVSGFGAFSVTGSAVSHCGDGDLDSGELCDPAMAGSATCCTSTCSIVSNGASCSDGNACTKSDTCQAGSCSSGSAVVCAASDQCHDAGSCAPATGVCSNPKKTDGSSCDDGNKCTQADTCVAGVCTGASPVTCSASDQCHVSGACDPASGLCSTPDAAPGTSCDDGNGCTLGDACDAGLCKPSGNFTCPPPEACHDAGICQAASGDCNYRAQADGTACGVQGSCKAGNCVEPNAGEGGAGGDTSAAGAASDGGASATGGAGGESGTVAGGAAGAPSAGGSAGLPNAGGSGGLPNAGGSGGLPSAGGSGGLPSAGGQAGVAALDGGAAGGLPMAATGTGASAGAKDLEPSVGAAPVAAAAAAHEASGCGCELPGGREAQGWPAFALLLAVGALGRVRRRAA